MEKLSKIMSLLACAAMFTLAPVTANAITDGSFETTGIPDWTTFNFAFQLAGTNMASGVPQDGTHVLQTFGPFVNNWDASGAYQQIAASPGQSFTLSGYGMNPTADQLTAGLSFGTLQIAWINAGNGIISTIDSAHIAAGQSLNTWTLLSVGGMAPLNTVAVRFLALHVNSPANEGGSIYFDNLSAVPEPSSIGLAVAGLLGFVAFLRKRRA